MTQQRGKYIVAVTVLTVICLLCAGITVWAVWFKDSAGSFSPDYDIKEEEQAQDIPNDSTNAKLSQPDGGGAVSLMWSDRVYVDISENRIELLFGNPSRSNRDMVLQIEIQGNIIAETGKIVPGKQIEEMKLKDGLAQVLSPGGYNGKFIISYFNGENGEKASVSSEIPVTVEVIY